jgi:hypothetical protein
MGKDKASGILIFLVTGMGYLASFVVSLTCTCRYNPQLRFYNLNPLIIVKTHKKA